MAVSYTEEHWADMDIAERYIDAQKDEMYEEARLNALCEARMHCNSRWNANPEACPHREAFTETCRSCPRSQD